MTKILLFVSEQIRIPLSRLEPTTRLLHDLGVDGDDAQEFLLAFAKTFGVDMTGFNFSKHFESEPHLFNFWRRKDTQMLDPITICDLYRSATVKVFLDA